MNNKPSFMDFIYHNHKGIIMGRGDRYYLEKKPKYAIFFMVIYIVLSILCFLIIPLLTVYQVTWPNYRLDFLVVFLCASTFIYYILYKRTEFELIEVHDISKNDLILLRRIRRILSVIATAFFTLCLIFALCNSCTAMYLRYLIGTPPVISSLSINDYHGYYKPDELPNTEESVVYYKDDNDDGIVSVSLQTVNLPDSICVLLNGQSVPIEYPILYYSWIWQPQTFERSCQFFFDIKDLPDISILEISSGSFSRQWTIKRAD